MNDERLVGAGSLICEARSVKKMLAQRNGQAVSTRVSERSMQRLCNWKRELKTSVGNHRHNVHAALSKPVLHVSSGCKGVSRVMMLQATTATKTDTRTRTNPIFRVLSHVKTCAGVGLCCCQVWGCVRNGGVLVLIGAKFHRISKFTTSRSLPQRLVRDA